MRKGTWKHGIYGYQKYDCRCQICVDAILESRAKWKDLRPKIDRTYIRLSGEQFVKRLELDGRLTAVNTSMIHKWLKYDIDIYAADRHAVRLGYHPYEIWGDAFYAGTELSTISP